MSSTDETANRWKQEPPSDDQAAEARHPCEAVAEQFLYEVRQGATPDVSAYLARHPHLARELEELLPMLLMLEQVGAGAETVPADEISGLPEVPDRIGSYRILREVGRGGMGIVYEAEHDTMRRRVALKVLPPNVASDPVRLERFHRESRAAGRLHHTNIVPVFEVGSADGFHFHAMQFIRGRSLDAVFHELRGQPVSDVYFRAIARIGLQVADALAYAHRQGVLHRDIKPANLILDATGVVWVADFGLAKEQDEDLTKTGDVVGTLRYLAPERLERPADVRSDIYGLGLTLYELLTLEHAFEASGKVPLLRRIVHEPPLPPRSHNETIPRDLETIVLKAIDKHPEHRYATAGEMAEDLQLFLEDRPIRSRLISQHERLWRWCRRNPQQAMLAALVSLMLGVLVWGSLLFALQSNYQARRLKSETDRAQKSERLAQRRLYDFSRGQAQALRWTGRPGQRLEGLQAIREAAATLPYLEFDPETERREFYQLRSEAVSNMVLPDLVTIRQWEVEATWTNCVAWDAEYQIYAQANQTGDLYVRRGADDHLIRRLPGSGERAWIVAMSADGRKLAAKYHHELGPSRVRLWDLSDGACLLDREDGLQSAAFAFHPNGRQLALGTRAGIELIDTTDGRVVQTLPETMDATFLAYGPRGDFLACTNMGRYEVGLWELSAGKRHVLPTSSGACGIAFAPDGHRLIVGLANGSMEELAIVSVNGDAGDVQRSTRTFKGHRGHVVGVAVDASGRWLASSSWDGNAHFLDLTSGEIALRVAGMAIARTQFHGSEPRLAFRSLSERRFGIWRLDDDGPLTILTAPEENTGYTCATWHAIHDRLVVAGHGAGLDIWDRGSESRVERVPAGHTNSVWFSRDGTRLLTSGGNGVRRWRIAPGHAAPRGTPDVLLSLPCERMSVIRDGELLAVDQGISQVVLLSGENSLASPLNVRSQTLMGPWGLDHAVLSPDGKWLAASTWQGHGVRVWDTAQLDSSQDISPDVGSASIAFSPDGARFVVCSANAQRLYEVGTWNIVWERSRFSDDQWPGPVAFSPDGRSLAVSHSRHLIDILDAETGRPLISLESPQAAIHGSFAFRADGEELLATARQELHIWDLNAIKEQLEQLGLGNP